MRNTAFAIIAMCVCASLFAGCVANRNGMGDGNELPGNSQANYVPHVVVAIIDTGINPYHEIFRRPNMTAHPSTWLEGFQKEIPAFNLTFGETYSECYEADKSNWAALNDGELVWFSGTNVMGIAAKRSPVDSAYPILDNGAHGTWVAGSVMEACPEAFIVSIQIDDDEDIVAANEWAAKQPWIDVVTTSWGKYIVGVPPEYVEEQDMGINHAEQLVYEAGKIQTNSAGNEPVPYLADEHGGPYWNIAVGGAFAGTNGDAWIAAKLPDVVSDFTQDHLAKQKSISGYETVSGTSFSCPRVAGTIAKALYDVRVALNYTGIIRNGSLIETAPAKGMLEDGKLTAGEVRTVLNYSAIYWTTTDFQPGNVDAIPINPAAPWLQMGWGYVNKTMAPVMVDGILGNKPLPEKDAAAVAYNQANYEARKAYWENAG
ncbi:MAG: S8 family serine peptidase [Candidatus Thermoplasmatota archaeon]|nr:S8 family serine peptidase [Candidatus Thermoplasmatota archaeon]